MPFADDGNMIRIVGDDVSVRDSIPVGIYVVTSLPHTDELVLVRTDFKTDVTLTGKMVGKRQKVLDTFRRRSSLGVLLSGEPGMGKTMFAQSMAGEALRMGMPVIKVDCDLSGLLNMLSGIRQPVMLLFDEVDKTFGHQVSSDDDDSGSDGQGMVGQQLLGILDAKSGGPRLSVLTCNQPSWLNSYLLNRTGRIYYHFRFDSLCGDELSEFLKYKGLDEGSDEFQRLRILSIFSCMNYDTVGVLVDELKAGYSLAESIEDLNLELGNGDLCLGSDSGDNMDVVVEVTTESGEVLISTCGHNGLYMANGALSASQFVSGDGYQLTDFRMRTTVMFNRSHMLIGDSWIELVPYEGDVWRMLSTQYGPEFRLTEDGNSYVETDYDDREENKVCKATKLSRVRVTGRRRYMNSLNRRGATGYMNNIQTGAAGIGGR